MPRPASFFARFVLLAALGVLSSSAAFAQVQRAFPQNALRGKLVITAPPEIALNDKAARLAPGARIRDPANMLILSGAIVAQPLLVHYTLDTLGLVQDVWILTPQEAAKRPWPATPQQAQAWVFDPVAQTWSKP
jgi:hypothetical protein